MVINNKCMKTGWFGIPRAPDFESTKVHVVDDNEKPLCGSVLRKHMVFQFCAHGIYEPYIDCQRCLSIAKKYKHIV